MQVLNWDELNSEARQQALSRSAHFADPVIEQRVREIMHRVRDDGDAALADLVAKFDHYRGELAVSREEITSAGTRLDPKLKTAMDRAFDNLSRFHRAQLPAPAELETSPGIICRSIYQPLDTVGLYVPGGSAPLLSTALMLAVPAAIAGCRQTVMFTPPPVSDAILYAAHLCNVSMVFRGGGAQAVAAMAYGTATVPRAVKIFGPGNQYVTMAKRLVAAEIAGLSIDMPAGPSEVMVIADQSAKPAFVAADLLSQAEHGPDSQVMLVSDSQKIIEEALKETDRQLQALPRADIARAALAHSRALKVSSVEEACEVACSYAPEHLILHTADPAALLPRIRNAGSVFVGEYTPESLGDYASGTNHTLPTFGYAQVCSALGTTDFLRRCTVQQASRSGLEGLADTVITMARAEGLEAHARAAEIRVRTAAQP